jgi:8-oxo-dGTP pyrophosphatase MutT (NUDIX family)
MVKPWPRVRSQPKQSFRVFSVRADTAVSPRTNTEHDFYVIESEDWINVIPLTADQKVVMIRQYRHGSRKVTLEIPGGLMDPGDTPEKAAARELLEETGYQAEKFRQIGVVNPNPALFNNRCYTFVASNVQKSGDPTPDQAEDIEVLLIPLSDIPELIRKGEIDHAMVITAFYWYFSQTEQGSRLP